MKELILNLKKVCFNYLDYPGGCDFVVNPGSIEVVLAYLIPGAKSYKGTPNSTFSIGKGNMQKDKSYIDTLVSEKASQNEIHNQRPTNAKPGQKPKPRR